MARITASSTLSMAVIPKFWTSVAEEELLSYREREKRKIAWQEIMDIKLFEWFLHPELFEVEGLAVISPKIISETLTFCRLESESPVPSNVVPNGDGGIVFEWKEGSHFRTIEFLADGSREDSLFIDSHLKHRHRF